ncbi:ATP-binding cassette domain-containing protein [Janibacter melonis]|uniref:ATP-binding cassette domain-containing protein n=1 Tax=Janibacter melonis TaxID=262209 RepID=UPI0027D9E511|nr:ATP-binding cassette domain-containing protein [Janibacter melonis]
MAEAEQRPTVVVDGLDIVYRVVGGSRRASTTSGDGGIVSRLRRRGDQPAVAREVPAVTDVSFVAHHGESIGIIGRNGSGKSTLLRAVAGLIPPTKGRIWVAGEPSLLGVNAVLMSQLSGERNIYIGGQALGLSRAQIRERFDEIVDFSGIGDAVYRPMRTYSSGMGARLRFAISTSAAPDVLMIDEALATGDADFRERSAERIASIRESAGTVFLVSHSNGSIRQICDRVLWMDQGRLVMDGPTEEVLGAYEETLPKRQRRRAKGEDTTPSEPDVPGVERVGGRNRVETAARLSARTYDSGVEGAFVVPSGGAAIMRQVVPAAARLGWPVLFSHKGNAPGSTRDELSRLQPSRVVVVGDEDQLSSQVVDQLRKIGPTERVDGRSSAEIGRKVLEIAPPQPGATLRVLRDDPGSMSTLYSAEAALDGQPLLVVDDAGLDDETLAAVASWAPARVVVGGEEGVLPATDVERLGAIAPVEHDARRGPMQQLVDRSAATGRTAPDALLTTLVTATGEALVTVLAAAQTGRPVLWLLTDEVPPPVLDEVRRLRPRSVVVVGGPDRVGHGVRRELGELVGEQ